MNPKSIKGLYVITDSALSAPDELQNHVEQALQGGARILQYRDKVLSPELRRQQAKALRTLCDRYNAVLIINDDIDLAVSCLADGIHLGKDDSAISEARRRLGPQALIGISCYNSIERALQMQALGADYVAFGRFYPSKTKPNAPQAEIQTLVNARQQLKIPLVAIGGIDGNNAQPLIDAGADSLAVIQGVFAQADITRASRQIQSRFTV
ncbi:MULTISPECIES: thiamine phosphate synthase [Thiomicrorhabdus]|uniref:Thiamine-phosphate synthase n=1 Tax=Thiomicrorhabdus heinhorstiae TaxID=2748010 RepID=A0ABS0C207_9GAMM|nr:MULTISPECIES: thiamine phosphate synthase [Thiomicrorhabdus]MBF6058246.1 thiamine phosphate synthase [Thiomicrorhabdus heinhorstiae]